MKNLFETLKAGTLIGKYLTGKESAKELEQLNEWIDDGHDNKSLFNSIKDKKQLANSIHEFDKFDIDPAWGKYNRSIIRKSKQIKYFRWKVAASIIIIATFSSVFLLNHMSKKRFIADVATQPITPGEPKAFIEFSNGIKFDLKNLDKNQKQKLATDAGILVEGNSVVSSNEKDVETGPELLTIVTPRGGEYKITLDDGTQVWLNADSRMDFPSKFAGNERKVKLTGEAYFSVSKDASRPFIVNLNGIDIEVLGTKFNISAYNNDDLIKTTLVEGKVSVKNSALTTQRQNILSPGEQACFNKGNKTIEIKAVDVYQYIAWKDGRFVFDYQTFGEIAKILGRWYDVDFVFVDSELKDIPFSGEFLRYDNIGKVYEIIRKTGTKLDFVQKGRTIEISN